MFGICVVEFALRYSTNLEPPAGFMSYLWEWRDSSKNNKWAIKLEVETVQYTKNKCFEFQWAYLRKIKSLINITIFQVCFEGIFNWIPTCNLNITFNKALCYCVVYKMLCFIFYFFILIAQNNILNIIIYFVWKKSINIFQNGELYVSWDNLIDNYIFCSIPRWNDV